MRSRKSRRTRAAGTEIGAAWAHQDGKGFNVKLDYLPLNGAEIVIREPKTKDVVQVGA